MELNKNEIKFLKRLGKQKEIAVSKLNTDEFKGYCSLFDKGLLGYRARETKNFIYCSATRNSKTPKEYAV